MRLEPAPALAAAEVKHDERRGVGAGRRVDHVRDPGARRRCVGEQVEAHLDEVRVRSHAAVRHRQRQVGRDGAIVADEAHELGPALAREG